jgi:hypothetical protein
MLFVTLAGLFFLSEARGAAMDHYLWDQVLQKHVKDGLVDYRKIKDHPQELNQYLGQIADFSKKELSAFPPAAQIAFYINAYNAITVKRIIDHFPPRKKGFFNFLNPDLSIKNISGVWDKIKDKVAGELLTLDDIEHNILRKEFNEPRIHMALVCASLSCPALLNQAFTAEKLDKQLDFASREFLTDKTRNGFCADCPKISLSKIFSWYGEDFLKKYPPSPQLQKKQGEIVAAVITFAAGYFPAKTKDFLLKGDYKTEFWDYDWSLNDLK